MRHRNDWTGETCERDFQAFRISKTRLCFRIAAFLYLAGLISGCASTQEKGAGGERIAQIPEAPPKGFERMSSLDERLAALEQQARGLSEAKPTREDDAGAPLPPPAGSAERADAEARGIEAARQERLGPALAWFDEAYRSGKLGTSGLLLAASSALRMGDNALGLRYARALWSALERTRPDALDEALAAAPQRDAALVLAIALLRQEDPVEGRDLARRLAEVNRGWEAPYVILAEHYLERGAPALALAVAQRGLDKLPEKDSKSAANDGGNPQLTVLRVRALAGLDRRMDAIRALREGFQRAPAHPGILLWLGIFEAEDGRRQSACERFSLAYAGLAEDPMAAHNHAACLAEGGKSKEALDVVRLALTRTPDDARLRYLEGLVHFRSGALAEARASWTRFLASAPRDARQVIAVQTVLETEIPRASVRELGLPGPATRIFGTVIGTGKSKR